MFAPRYAALFTSRWMAIAWCILICLSAIGFVGAGLDDDAASAVPNAIAGGATALDLD